MSKILIVGDSQSVNPGKVAARELKTLGHTVRSVSNVGMGPYDYVRLPNLWAQYLDAVRDFKPDLIVLIFGTNDAPSSHLDSALARLKSGVKPKVILTGPPQYPDADRQTNSEKVRSHYQAAFGADYLDSYPYTDVSLPRDALGLHFTAKAASGWGVAIAHEAHKRVTPAV